MTKSTAAARFTGTRKAFPLSAIALAVAATSVPQVLAQENRVALEEVIVTARKREESIQKVPVSVTSLGKELQEASLRRLDDIQSFTPNVYIRTTAGIPGGAAISIRGVSYQETDKTLDPSIGVIMDGLYLGTSSGSLLNNFDTKRIEVLRGPQGTLHGKNTTGGVVNVVRGDITMEWGGDVSVTLGDDGREDIKGVLNIPIIEDKLGVKVFANQIKSDGWVRNVTIGEDVFGDDKNTYGFAALWQATENLDIKFHYERNIDKTDTGANVNASIPGVGQDTDCNLQGALYPVSCDAQDLGDEDRTTANDRNHNDSEYDTYIGTINWDFDKFLLTSITGYRTMDEAYRFEFDGGSQEFLSFDYTNEWDQFSQELRVTSDFSDSIDIVAGLFYWEVEYAQDWNVYELLSAVAALPPSAVSANGQSQDATSYAAFGQADWHITDQWTITVGGRYTYEEKDFTGGDGSVYFLPAPRPDVPTRDFDDDWEEFTGKLGFTYQHTDDLMVFGSWSEGFKSGGFFGRQANFDINPTYEPEYVTNWELGMKSTWMDGRMIFNPTIFFNDYEDKQEDVLIFIDPTNVATVIRNASTLEIWGAELELQFQVTEAWNIRASYGYLDASYDDYVADINGDGIETDNSDITPRNTPENTIGLNTTYTMDIGPGELVGAASYRWRDEIEVLSFRDPSPGAVGNDPLGHLGSIQNLDLTINYIWADGRYRVTGYGRNVTDERERVVSRIPGLTSWASWNQGANYGVEFAASF
ncbi:TonB-dependent receptor [Halieaceae bacterium IMCC14734]|uniref:TonB-dependent receptor n=1 Tax=Candidatus Litorirhabdus singularis TaxID=2518993 RepID=A0ABT3TDV4_9GAMM|nr:TonB-dependent receptor [Candidatus Litorirhabdus singularis]MCX2980448.1 TonB-dependent receptor [Candidatus Litorirhabdus singularis]